ncbi:MAG: NAD-dependent deacylase [Elusimicrobiota bacterium]|nr:NAD-dependent deacylase [Elusimicrobiota bacterium]
MKPEERIHKKIERVVEILKKSKYVVAFSGAGVSVESGIPPFRGADGIWNHYDEKMFELDYFLSNPEKVWKILISGFYRNIVDACPNGAHIALARMQIRGQIKGLITQNIDGLHSRAGSRNVLEIHGNAHNLVCMKDGSKYTISDFDLKSAPRCPKCRSILKPDFVFFGERLPQKELEAAHDLAANCDAMIVVGTQNKVYPAAEIPLIARQNANSATIIEINPQRGDVAIGFSNNHIQTTAVKALEEIEEKMF